MTDQRSVDNSHLSLDQNLKGPLGNLAAALNSILGLGKGRRDLFGKTTMTDVLHLRRIASPPSNPSRGMIILPDGANFDPLDDDGESLCYWDNVNSVWAALGSGNGSTSGIPYLGFSGYFHATASAETTLGAGANTKIAWDTGTWVSDSPFSFANDQLEITADWEGLWLLTATVYAYAHANRHSVKFYNDTTLLKVGGTFSEKTDLAGAATGTVLAYLYDGDLINVRAYSDAAINTYNGSGEYTHFSGVRLSVDV